MKSGPDSWPTVASISRTFRARSTAPTAPDRRSPRDCATPSGCRRCSADSKAQFSETDFTEDLKKIDVPTLILHGDDDQIVPIDASARMSVKLVKGAKLVEIPGAPHGLCSTHKDRINQELLAFFKTPARRGELVGAGI
jgi:pimeloyl-ACP methyl ester carboxylesterase